jgi:hypothetical protein
MTATATVTVTVTVMMTMTAMATTQLAEDSSADGSDDLAGGGIGGTGISTGPVTAHGGIVTNGIDFSTDTAKRDHSCC